MLFKRETKEENVTRKTADRDKLYRGKSAFGTILFAAGAVLFIAGILNLTRRGDYSAMLVIAGAIYMVVGALFWDWPRWLLEKRKERKLARRRNEPRPKMKPRPYMPVQDKDIPPENEKTTGSKKDQIS